MPVKAAVGNDVAEMAVARLAELGGKEHAVRMLVTTMGLYVVERGSGDTLKEVRMRLTGGRSGEGVAVESWVDESCISPP